jgi:hypothetical protein
MTPLQFFASVVRGWYVQKLANIIAPQSVCVQFYMWRYSQEPAQRGPYPPTLQVLASLLSLTDV